jgi:hypothetical protein
MAKVLIEGVRLQDEQAWDGTGGALPPGNYLFKVTGVEQKPANTGNPQMILQLEVIDGAESQAHNGRGMKHFIMLMASTKGRVKHMLDVCGIVPDDDGGFDDESFMGAEFAGVVETNTFTKPDPATGQTVEKTNTKINQERPASDWETILAELGVGAGGEGGTVAAPAAVVTKPAPAPVAARPAPARQQQPLPPPGAAPAAASAANAGVPAGQPRVATGLPKPGTRVAVRAR